MQGRASPGRWGGAMERTLAPTACPFCGVERRPTDRFCGGCSAPLSSAARAPRASAPGAAERAQAPTAPDDGSAAEAPDTGPGAGAARPGRPLSPWGAAAEMAPPSPDRLPRIVGVPRILGIAEPWFFLLTGLVLAPILTFTPILRYMGWFLGSLFHETGHAAMGWLLGCPTVPAIRIDGHAAAIHGEPSMLLRGLVMLGLAGLLVRMRARPVARVLLGLALLAYPAIAYTETREVAFLVAGHLGEAGFATVLLLQALDGGFSGTPEERATHSMVGWYLVGRNVSLCGGLLFQSAARSAYAESGSFGLVNDYLRLARHFGIGLEPIALVMLVVAVLPVPLAILLEARRGLRA